MIRNQILVGDCLDTMPTIPAGSIHCCVTSPPYWGLRDYGIPPRTWGDGEVCAYGSEQSPEAFVRHTVEVFAEVRRVLRDDGTLWLNFGDSYAQDGKWGGSSSNKNEVEMGYPRPKGKGASGLKAGDLCNIPHRVAAALQAAGWYWRSTIVWHKRSPMPESVSGWRWMRCQRKVANGAACDVEVNGLKAHSGDIRNTLAAQWEPCPGCKKCEPNGGLILRQGKWRPTTGHEYIFLFSKSEQYFCDATAVAEPAVYASTDRQSKKRGEFNGKNTMPGKESFRAFTETRNPRSVWTFSNEPFKGSHFAVFPTALPRRCIEAATSAGGCCSQCGSPYAPLVHSERVATRPGNDSKVGRVSDDPDSPYERQSGAVVGNRDPQRHIAVKRVEKYLPTCKCGAEPGRSVVLDPFGGSGTTAQVARNLDRDWVICELNPEYAKLAEQRIALPLREKKPKKKSRPVHNQQVLFE